MKTQFTKQYILDNRECYSEDKVLKLNCITNKVVTLEDLFKELPVKDFSWFFIRKCQLTTNEIGLFALHCAKQVIHIYECKFPKDKRVRECIEAIESYINGNSTLDQLKQKRTAAYAASAASTAYAASAASAAAYAAAYAASAAYAADAADAAAYAAASAADAASAAYAAEFNKSILNFIKQLNQ